MQVTLTINTRHTHRNLFTILQFSSDTMKFFAALATTFGLLATTSAVPLDDRAAVQTVDLIFHGGPAQYNLTLPADGKVYPTSKRCALKPFPHTPPALAPLHPSFPHTRVQAAGSNRSLTDNGLNINIIDAPDYNAFYQCKFHTAGQATLASSISAAGVNEIMVGPPQAVTGVSCQGMCVPTYGDCYDVHGQFVGPCCSGFCAADKCRPWVNPF